MWININRSNSSLLWEPNQKNETSKERSSFGSRIIHALWATWIALWSSIWPTWAQDIQMTPEMYRPSQNSAPWHTVYSCTPNHVERWECIWVDDSYYRALAISQWQSYAYEVAIMTYNWWQQAVWYVGHILPWTAEVIMNTFEENPDLNTLIITSEWWSTDEAHRLSEFISQNGIEVVILWPWSCISACSTIFLASENPQLHGAIWIHTWSIILNDYTLSPNPVELGDYLNGVLSTYFSDLSMIIRSLVDMWVERPQDILLALFSLESGEILSFSDLSDLIAFSIDRREDYISVASDSAEWVNINVDVPISLSLPEVHLDIPENLLWNEGRIRDLFYSSLNTSNTNLNDYVEKFISFWVKNPELLMLAMLEANGQYITFHSLDDMINFNPDNYTIMSWQEVLESVEGWSTPNFQYEWRDTVFSSANQW